MIKVPTIASQSGKTYRLGQLYGCAPAIAAANIARNNGGVSLLLAHSAQQARQIRQDIKFFLADDFNILLFPEWETLPYDNFAVHPYIVSERLNCLAKLPTATKTLLIVTATSLLQKTCPPSHLQEHSFNLSCNGKLDRDNFVKKLSNAGYKFSQQVRQHGEFALRGSIIDFFPMGQKLPLRIDMWADEIETLKTFDPETQRSIQSLNAINLLPAHEIPMDAAAISTFRSNWRQKFSGDPLATNIYRQVSDGNFEPGIEYYLPLFFPTTATLLDYLPAASIVIDIKPQTADVENFSEQLQNRYQQRSCDPAQPILEPAELYLNPRQLAQKLSSFCSVEIEDNKVIDSDNYSAINLQTKAPRSLKLDLKAAQPSMQLASFIADFSGKIIFVVDSAGHCDSLLKLLRNLKIYPKKIKKSCQIDAAHSHYIAIWPLSQGMENADYAIITASQIYGERATSKPQRRQLKKSQAQNIISNLGSLEIGSAVVHDFYGVGRYGGLQNLSLGDIEQEFLCLLYADDDKLYVPVDDLQLISRYSGADLEHAPLHKLGSTQWQKQKAKAAQQIHDVAAELLAIEAQREHQKSVPVNINYRDYELFASAFMFEETADQQRAIDEVLNDLASSKAMDRLICGDVGFGKTEVAMRAAFVVAMAARQVCILVPTTLLAKQHYENFCDRFASWPLKIAVLSRFGSSKQQQQTVNDLATGSVDIVIGTHKLLNNKIKFKQLGLVIVDEEQRFGVSHKEQLKKLRAEVDILTLTATPIPRTLNMAMSGIRDLSIIATAPKKRTAVKTFVSLWDDNLLKEAFSRELGRGGQIYFVHNKVQNIQQISHQVQQLAPTAKLAIAHGQMPERELEAVMLNFYHQRIDILVSTTIIENGIDVPTANTIIINRADLFGLAQLHQMRGRVGRSHHLAYAYLLRVEENAISADAKKRLDAIESLEELGAGFMLAAHDLEIRGAGELLGAEQSGQIQQIGYSMYSKMLAQAVASLKKGEQFHPNLAQEQGIKIDLGVPALLPDDYVANVHTRLTLYRKIAKCDTKQQLAEMKLELLDRFGKLPQATINLLRIRRLKQYCALAGITNIDARKNGGSVEFDNAPNIEPIKIIQILQQNPLLYKFDGNKTLRFSSEFATYEERIDFIFAMLKQLMN